jgi:hypothetical protein
MVTSGEILVVDYVPDREGSAWPVVATVPPRVTVLRAGADAVPAIARASRLAIARGDDDRVEVVGDDSVLGELDDGARLFVEAWRSQARATSDRPGDGLPWDAPGFEPPDPPPGVVDPSQRHGES